ncbi:zinc finger CCCH domain-containing protein 7-like [Primulina tabacum]|uniref:zinc finger CCCH domain-containing protein 7-like n=1 Tax=Primulina tabacum TaxID=48773 RepID=UPI003F5A96F6
MEEKFKKSYVPKRLLIGNDEYVRIGTGNQLVRDPKKRNRVLVRIARLRLARKRKYCQFFTRFGKCNKSDGKCPCIHDPSKIVVCTKFLNGSCTDCDCKLTHKVIPEKMPDCSYFLKGSRSNENCPYRHVNVNPESSICKRFLRGYCADGNECRTKHTYVRPAFESTGICPQSSMCKLHHPKKKIEKKPVIEQKIVRGQYFDGGLIDVAECSMATGDKLFETGEDDIVCEEGEYPDYISLDISNDGPEMTVL